MPEPIRTTGELQARVRELEGEVARLEQQLLQSTRQASAAAGAPRTIFGLSAMVLMLTPDKVIEYANSAFLMHVGMSRDEVIGKPLEVVDHGRFRSGFLNFVVDQARRAGGTHNVETTVTDAHNGQMKYLKVSATVTPNQIQLVLEDVSRVKMLESTFKRYVSPKVIERLVANNFDVMAAQRYEMTVLFADLRGFTSLCTGISPDAVKRLVDTWLTEMMRVIIDHDATVDKVVGDEVMALFGVPIRSDDHAVRSIDVAIKMQRAHRAVMEHWRSEGLPPPPMGIGINTGEMVVGNIGSELHLSYTVLGHEVNLAARLCSAARGHEILIGPRTFELAREALMRDRTLLDTPVKFKRGDVIQAKGIAEPIQTILVAPEY